MSQQPVISHEAPVFDRQQLPARPPEPFFGREPDLTSARLVLRAGTAVLLYGPGGIGKTALAAALAVGETEQAGGVVWLDVYNEALPSLLARIARAYGAAIPATDPVDTTTLMDTVSDLLHANRPLLVLDGQIRLDAAREFIRQVATGIPLILTSTASASGPWTPQAVQLLAADDARAMLISLSGLPPDADVVALSEALGGHALSMVVAASQIGAAGVQPDEFLAQMPAMPPGEANRVMGVLMASYRLLPKDLQGMVLLIGTAFAGGASDELLADVSGASADAIRGRMRQLAERGFVWERSVYGQPYFATHELIQVFARTFLRGKKQLEPMQARHLKALMTFVRRATHNQIATEVPNLTAGGIYAAENGQRAVLNEIVSSLDARNFAEVRHYHPEIGWLRQLIELPALAQTGVLGALVEEVAVPPTQEAYPLGESAAPVLAAAVAPESEAPEAEPPEAEAPVEVPETLESQPAAEAVSAPPSDMPEFLPETRTPSEPVIVTERPSVPLPTNVELLGRIRQDVLGQGDPTASISQYTEALEGYKADGNVHDELAAIEALAMLSLESENYEAVLAYVDQGTALAQEASNPQREGELLIILGDLQVTLGRWEGAEVAYEEAVEALKATASWPDIGLTLDKLGVLYMEQNRFDEAITAWKEAIPALERAGRSDLLSIVHSRLGDVHTEMMQWEPAESYYQRALELARSTGDEMAIFDQLDSLGVFMELSGRWNEAQRYYRQALHLAYMLDDEELLGQTLASLARLLIDDTAQLHRAVQVLEAASQYLPDDFEVRRLLSRAQTRQNRLLQAGVTLPLADDSLQDYARAAADMA